MGTYCCITDHSVISRTEKESAIQQRPYAYTPPELVKVVGLNRIVHTWSIQGIHYIIVFRALVSVLKMPGQNVHAKSKMVGHF